MAPNTAVRRAPARRRPAELLATPSQQLPPRPSSWGREATGWVAVGIAGFGAAPLLDHPALAGPALVAGAVTGLTRGVLGRRDQIRGELADRLVEALSPGLGLRGGPDRRVVRLKSWRRGWPGVPRRVVLRYAPGVDDTDPLWLPALLGAVTRRLLADYEVREHDRRRCRITLGWVPSQDARPDKAAAQLRAERTIGELLGPTATVTGVEWAGEELAALEVRHEAATKLAASGYRNRVERVVSTMLPGRWRARWDLQGDTVRFELRPSLPKQVPHPAPVITVENRFHIPLAVDEDGDTVTWHLRGTGPHLLVIGKTGQGKALAVGTPVPTPEGWTTMGALVAGDRVFDETGAVARVVSAHPVLYDRPCYRITFSDGEQIVADAEHLWGTTTRAQRMAASRTDRRSSTWWSAERVEQVRRYAWEWAARPDEQVTIRRVLADLWPECENLLRVVGREVGPDGHVTEAVVRRTSGQREHYMRVRVATYSAQRLTKALAVRAAAPINAGRRTVNPDDLMISTTSELAASVRTRTGHLNHAIPLAGPLAYVRVDLPIDPYVLGLWLGDGHSRRAQLFTADPEVIEQVEAAGYPCVKIRQRFAYGVRGLQAHLRQAGLLGDKHIPVPYLHSSEQHRRALLAGLLDSDGTCNPQDGRVLFAVTNRRLAQDAHELITGLGYKPSWSTRRCKGRSERSSTVFTVGFTPGESPVFRLTRKAVRQRPSGPRSTARVRYVVDVEPVPSEPVRCITVDSPSRLYLAGRHCVPTHNTVLMNGVVMELTDRDWPVWICDPKRIEFLGMRGWPNVQVVATSVQEQVVVVYRAWDEMERRYQLIESGDAVEDDFEPLILVLDEYRDFYGIVAEWYAGIKVTGMPARCPVLEKVSSIVRKGRSARVHVVLGLQRPDADVLSGEMRDNFGTRISLGPLSPQGAMMMWESPHVGVSLPRGIAGRATAVSDEAQPLEVQAYWTPDPRRAAHAGDPQDLELLEQLRPAGGRHGPLQVHLDQELLNTLDEKGRSQEWAAVMGGQLQPATAALAAPAAGPAAVVLSKTPEVEELPVQPAPATRNLRLVTDDEIASRRARQRNQDHAEVPDGDELEDAGGVDEQVPAGEVLPGDLVMVQDSPQLWGLVESAEPDIGEEELLCIDWRSDDDDAGSMVVPEQSYVTVRRGASEAADAASSPSGPRDWPWGG